MLLHEMKYDYDKLLENIKKYITQLYALPFPEAQGNDRALMIKGAIEYFYILTDWHPDASGDVGRFLEQFDKP